MISLLLHELRQNINGKDILILGYNLLISQRTVPIIASFVE